MGDEKKEIYYVDYGTGAGNFVSKKSLAETLKEAEAGMSYTEQDVLIYKVKEDFMKNQDINDLLSSSPMLRSMWVDQVHSGGGIDNLKRLCDFGKAGYYTEWCDENGLARAINAETTKNISGGIFMNEASTQELATMSGEKRDKAYDQTRIGRYYYNGNAKAFYEGIKDGTLPAVSKEGAEMKDGMITMTPTAIRYYTNGKMFTGVNQLVAQKFAHEMGFQPDKDGNINVVTYRQAGEKNLMKGQKHFPLASYDKEKNQVNYYNLYPESALIDKAKTIEAKSPYDKRQEHTQHPDLTITATNSDISLAEYFGKYEAATKLGAKFVTTEATIKSIQEKAEKEIAPHIETGLTGKVYAMSATMSNVSKDEIRNLFQSMKPQTREMTIQHDQSMSMS